MTLMSCHYIDFVAFHFAAERDLRLSLNDALTMLSGHLFQRPRTRLESWGTHDHYDDARLWSTVSCECEDG